LHYSFHVVFGRRRRASIEYKAELIAGDSIDGRRGQPALSRPAPRSLPVPILPIVAFLVYPTRTPAAPTTWHGHSRAAEHWPSSLSSSPFSPPRAPPLPLSTHSRACRRLDRLDPTIRPTGCTVRRHLVSCCVERQRAEPSRMRSTDGHARLASAVGWASIASWILVRRPISSLCAIQRTQADPSASHRCTLIRRVSLHCENGMNDGKTSSNAGPSIRSCCATRSRAASRCRSSSSPS